MSVTVVLDLVKAYAESKGWPADKIVDVLAEVSDTKSIPLKIYGSDMGGLTEPRQVLDPLEITMENVMGVSKRKISIQPGVTLLYGPNGSGKTTTMRSMLYALFGGSAAGVARAEDMMLAGQSSMQVGFQFTGGKITRALERRVIKRGKDAGREEVEHGLAVQIAGDKANKAKEAQALIDGWLGVDGAFVRRVCCLEQGMLTQVMDEQPARRRELFYRMLSLDPCEATRKTLSQALQVEENSLVIQRQEMERLATEIAALQHKRSSYPVDRLKMERDRLAPQAASAQAQPGELKDLRDRLARRELDKMEATRQADNRKQYLAKIDELKRDPVLNLVAASQVGKELGEAEHAVNVTRDAASRHQAELDRLSRRGKDIAALPAVCPTCETVGKRCEVTPEVKEHTLAALRAEWKVAASTLAGVKKDLEARQYTVERLRTDAASQQRDQQRQAYVLEQIKLLDAAVAQLPAYVDTHAIDADVLVLAQSIKVCEQKGSPKLAEDLAVMDKALAEAAGIDAQIAALQKKRVALADSALMTNEQLEAFRWGVAAFAKDGIPLWLARKHLDRVNSIASELCTLDKYSYDFGPDLEVRVLQKDKSVQFGPELACGSARERGAVVLMAALGRYLQELSGLKIPLLWIDELPFQDEANAHLVVDMIRRLTQWYPKVVLCSSRWDEYLGQFDHEIALTPEDLTIELDRQRETKKRKERAIEPGGLLKEPPVPQTPGVCTYDPSLRVDTPAVAAKKCMDAIAEAEAALTPPPDPTPKMDADLDDDLVPF